MSSAKKIEGLTDEERAALKARARELKSARRPGAREADGEADVIAKIAEMPEPDRTLVAVTELTTDVEARIGDLVKKAVS